MIVLQFSSMASALNIRAIIEAHKAEFASSNVAVDLGLYMCKSIVAYKSGRNTFTELYKLNFPHGCGRAGFFHGICHEKMHT